MRLLTRSTSGDLIKVMPNFRPIAPRGTGSPTSSVSSIAPKRSKCHHDDLAWEAIRPTIYQLYIQENKSAAQVLDALSSNRGNPFKTCRRTLFTKFREWGLRKNKQHPNDPANPDDNPGASGSSGPVVSLSPTTRDSPIEDTPNMDSVSQPSGDSATSPITTTEPTEPIYQGEDGDMLSRPNESGDTMDDNDTWGHLPTLDVLVDTFDKRFHLVDAEDQSTSEVKSSSNTSKPRNDLFATAGTDFADSFVCFPDQEGEHVSDPATATDGVFAEDQHDECYWDEISCPESPPELCLSCNIGQDSKLERKIDALDYVYQDAETIQFPSERVYDAGDTEADFIDSGFKPLRIYKICVPPREERLSKVWDTPRDFLIAIADLEERQKLEDESRERIRQFRISFINQCKLLQPVLLQGYETLRPLANQLKSRHRVWHRAIKTMRGLARLKAPSGLRDVVSFLCVSRAVVECSQEDRPAHLLEFSQDLDKWKLAFPEIGDIARHMWGIKVDGNFSFPRSYNVLDPSATSFSAEFITKLKESVVSLIGKTVDMFDLDEDSVPNLRHQPTPNSDTPSQQSVTPKNPYLSSSEHLGPTHAHRRKRKRRRSGGTLSGETSSKPPSPGVERLYDLTSRDKRFSAVAVTLATGFIFAIVIFFILCMIYGCNGAAVPFGLTIDPWRPHAWRASPGPDVAADAAVHADAARQSEPGDEVAQGAPSAAATSLAEQSDWGPPMVSIPSTPFEIWTPDHVPTSPTLDFNFEMWSSG
ncbi:hypothetical protein QBC37DRAFT_124517 [Rhypophila decipiens]|uniref:Clr5 domain-containing protein n=1 Tax=Rhypophila decipiens TaxID=261697 RepID=A0AAN6XVV0_9PEZI|nr:hypothetical protein QBC37DRAFT_124517 [Rhypophila decipiens]